MEIHEILQNQHTPLLYHRSRWDTEAWRSVSTNIPLQNISCLWRIGVDQEICKNCNLSCRQLGLVRRVISITWEEGRPGSILYKWFSCVGDNGGAGATHGLSWDWASVRWLEKLTGLNKHQVDLTLVDTFQPYGRNVSLPPNGWIC